jgi:hypothetical protein
MAGPEFIFHTALGQLIEARRSVKEFEDAGLTGWTVKHGFFAAMGGYVLQPPDFVPFPLDLKQVYYLVTHGYVDYADVLLMPSEIDDKNKFDGMTRLMTALQLSWFVINALARVAQGMAITTLELSTLGFVFCSLCTYFVWRSKPQDVTVPVILVPRATMAEILVRAGPVAATPYCYTPMDFASAKRHWFNVIWHYCFKVVAGGLGIHFHPRRRPIDKIWDDCFPEVGFWGNAVLACVQLGFAGIHIAAWNFHFPTSQEAMLWRISSLYIIWSMLMTWLMLAWSFQLHPWVQQRWDSFVLKGTSSPSLEPKEITIAAKRTGLRRLKERLCNNPTGYPMNQQIPLMTVLTVPLGSLYIVARLYIILEDVINLRSLPTSAYKAIDWNVFLPHIS